MKKKILILVLAILLSLFNCNKGRQKQNQERYVENRDTAQNIVIETRSHNDQNSETNIYFKQTKDFKLYLDKARALPLFAQDSIAAMTIVCIQEVQKYQARKFREDIEKSSIEEYKESDKNIRITMCNKGRNIITVEKRTLKDNKSIAHDLFIFNEKNTCIARSTYKNEWHNSFEDVLFDETILRYDKHERILPLTETEKQQIIREAKTSLDSLMQLFPGFEYNFNWK